MTTSPPPVDLDQLAATLAAGISPLPWHEATDELGSEVYSAEDWRIRDKGGLTEADAAAIVASVNAAPALIAELRDARAKLTAVEALHRPRRGYCVVCDEGRDVDREGNNPDCPHRASYCAQDDAQWPCRTVRALGSGS